LKIIPGPDFPTGGKILATKGLRSSYLTGQGVVPIQATTHFEAAGNSNSNSNSNRQQRTAIVVTELPYLTNKAQLLEKIAELVNTKRIVGISDLRDESDRDGIRLVIELKKDAIPLVVLNNLFKQTNLQSTFATNFVALMNEGKQPKRLSLKESLSSFLSFRSVTMRHTMIFSSSHLHHAIIFFRFETIRKRTSFQLKKLQHRSGLVSALLFALKHIDTIINIMKTSQDVQHAKQLLISLIEQEQDKQLTQDHQDPSPTSTNSSQHFSDDQVEAILSLTLRRLTSLEAQKLQQEQSELSQQMMTLEAIMTEDAKVNQIIIEESLQLKKKYAKPRQSEIIYEFQEDMTTEDLTANERCVIVLTSSGYIKRLSIDEFEAQSRGGKGRSIAKLKDGSGNAVSKDKDPSESESSIAIPTAVSNNQQQDESIKQFFSCMTHDSLMFISDHAVCYNIKAHKVPVSSRIAKGTALPQLISMASNETITSIIPVKFPVTAKVTKDASEDSDITSTTENSDVDAQVDSDVDTAVDAEEIVDETESDDSETPASVSSNTTAAPVEDGEEYLAMLTKKGYLKKTPIRSFKSASAAKNLRICTLEEGDELTWARRCYANEEIVIATKLGYCGRFPTNDLRSSSRYSRGGVSLGLRGKDKIADMDILQPRHYQQIQSVDDDQSTDDTSHQTKQKSSSGNKSSPKFLIVTERGYGKRVDISDFSSRKRGNKGIIATKFKQNEPDDAIRALRVCQEDDEVVISTTKGTVIRQRVANIPEQSRTARGVLLQDLDEGDRVAMVDIVPAFVQVQQQQES
jgi:DNA gyrase subunit A